MTSRKNSVLYVSGQISIVVSDLSEIGKLMAALRNTPPAEVGGVKSGTIHRPY